MGKWTPDYTDDVLHAKVSTLVSGAIRRVAVERETTKSITYESFVTDLDTGDSFTASLIDILVKEIADRRSRPTPSDRSLLSERTVGSLRSLARSSRSYSSNNRFRSHARRSVHNLPDYLAASSADAVVPGLGGLHELDSMMMDDDEEEYVIDLAGSGGNDSPSGLWDTGLSRRLSGNPLGRSPSPIPDEWHPPPLRIPGASGSISNPRWTSMGGNGNTSLLSRQASIRRAVRRGVDFNESSGPTSLRRRYSARDAPSSVSPHNEAPEMVTEPRDGLMLTRPSLAAQAASGRRFFPFPRVRGHDSGPHSGSRDSPLTTDWSDIPPWNAALADEAEASSGGEAGDSEHIVVRAPRLRRGGVLPPEMAAVESSRRASPVYTISNAEGAEPTTEQVLAALDGGVPGLSMGPVPFIPPPYEPESSATDTEVGGARPVDTAVSEEPVAYPTPGGSTEGENIS